MDDKIYIIFVISVGVICVVTYFVRLFTKKRRYKYCPVCHSKTKIQWKSEVDTSKKFHLNDKIGNADKRIYIGLAICCEHCNFARKIWWAVVASSYCNRMYQEPTAVAVGSFSHIRNYLQLDKWLQISYNPSCPRETNSDKEVGKMFFFNCGNNSNTGCCSIWQILSQLCGFGC